MQILNKNCEAEAGCAGFCSYMKGEKSRFYLYKALTVHRPESHNPTALHDLYRLHYAV